MDDSNNSVSNVESDLQESGYGNASANEPSICNQSVHANVEQNEPNAQSTVQSNNDNDCQNNSDDSIVFVMEYIDLDISAEIRPNARSNLGTENADVATVASDNEVKSDASK